MAGFTLNAQNPFALPMACGGAVEQYWVKGFPNSLYNWRVLDSNGDPVNVEITQVNDTTVMVYWRPELIGGIYTFEVIEHTIYGCTGEPYTEDIVLNTSGYLEVPLENVADFFQVCRGDIVALAPGNFQNFLWTIDNSVSPVYYTGTAGTYEVRLVDYDYNCAYHPITSFVNELPDVNLGKDTLLFGAQNLLLDAYTSYKDSLYHWEKYNFQNTTWSEIVLAYNNPTYMVEGGYGDQWISVLVTDFNQCSNSDSIYIKAENYNEIFIPRAFTPNGDGVNDTWVVPIEKLIQQGLADLNPWYYLKNVEVLIFNRWGKLVWKSTGPFREWNGNDMGGRTLPMDSYHYIIHINIDDKVFTHKGSVTIVR